MRRPKAAFHRTVARLYARAAIDRAGRAQHHAQAAAALGHPLRKPLA